MSDMPSGLASTLARVRSIETTLQQLGHKLENPAVAAVTSVAGQLASQGFEGILNQATPTPPSFAMPTSTGAGAFKLPASLQQTVERQARLHGIDPALVSAVIKAESGFNPQAVSSVGAQGLMQLMPATAKSMGVENAFDPAQNIAGGVKYLAGLLRKFGGDKALAVAAYNAGPGAVERYNGIPPYKETQQYVQRVLSYKDRFTETAAATANQPNNIALLPLNPLTPLNPLPLTPFYNTSSSVNANGGASIGAQSAMAQAALLQQNLTEQTLE
jgi:soluble lytic murein transglycosylase-like protein